MVPWSPEGPAGRVCPFDPGDQSSCCIVGQVSHPPAAWEDLTLVPRTFSQHVLNREGAQHRHEHLWCAACAPPRSVHAHRTGATRLLREACITGVAVHCAQHKELQHREQRRPRRLSHPTRGSPGLNCPAHNLPYGGASGGCRQRDAAAASIHARSAQREHQCALCGVWHDH